MIGHHLFCSFLCVSLRKSLEDVLFGSIGLLRFRGQLHHKQRTSIVSSSDEVDACSLKIFSASLLSRGWSRRRGRRCSHLGAQLKAVEDNVQHLRATLIPSMASLLHNCVGEYLDIGPPSTFSNVCEEDILMFFVATELS